MNRQFKPSGYNQHFFHPLPQTFADYQQRCRQMIHHVRSINQYCPQTKHIDEITPYQLGPADAKRGILLIHGLLETPFLLRDIANHFADNNYLVRSILLPGHGTSPGDLLNLDYHAWQQACHYGIDDLCQNVDELYLCGYSTGALLALLVNYQHPTKKINGLILFAPAIKLAHYPAPLINLTRYAARFIPPLRWLKRREENDFARYHSLPLNAAYQVYQLSCQLKLFVNQSPVQLPMFVVTAMDDVVIDCLATINFLQQQPHPANHMIVYANQSVPTNCPQITQVNSHYPQQNIAHFSHICLAVAPENYHYGRHGDYSITLKSNDNPPCYGELHQKNITHRLSYNPHFHQLMRKIDNFMDKIKK